MSDVNTFIDTIGKDVNATVVPQIQTLAQAISAKAHADYVPRISAFANELVKDIIDEQSETVRTFVSGVIADLFQRYRPELTGELHAKLVQGAIEVTGQAVTLDVKRRDTGASVSALDIPVSLRIRVDEMSVNLQNTTIRLDVIK
jgi:NADPH-dependent curcumin reductase CurA